MIEPRVYRAAFVPALLVLVLAAFSLEDRPRPLPQGLAADVLFDGNLAAQSAAAIADRRPDRRAGTLGDLGTGRGAASMSTGSASRATGRTWSTWSAGEPGARSGRS